MKKDKKLQKAGKKETSIVRSSAAEYLTFVAASGQGGVEAVYADENIWLSQKMMSVLYDVNVRTVNEHLKKIFSDSELQEDSVIRKFRITAADGKNYNTLHYNLSAIIAVGYKVNSERAVQFRKWATTVIKEYTIKAYSMDDERLKNDGSVLSRQYFDEQLQRIREIRLSERKFYQKITDIYATAMDYDVTAQATKRFFATVQNKLHWAIHGQTAAEVIYGRTDANNNPLVTTYSYDTATGELISVDYSDATPDIAYTFTRTGQPLTITDVVGTHTFTYNAQLQEVSETITGGLYSKVLIRSYTTTGMKGRKLGLAVGGVANYSYGYDVVGRLNQITTPAGDFDYTRLANSDLVSQMTRPNGVTTIWSYEQYRDLITQVQNGAISTYGYVNDAIGRRTSMSRAGSAHPTSDTITYSYNDRSEVTGALSDVDASYSYTYAYDPIGNRISANEAGIPWTYTANQLNQYTAMTEDQVQMVPTYDLDGSMSYRPVDATTGWTQVWNGENRMVETTKGTDRLEFKYDYMGRRVEKKVYDGQTLTTHLKFVYDDFKLVEELDGLNTDAPLRRYAWQPNEVGLDVVLQMMDVPGNAKSFHLHDANKNVMQDTDINGLVNTSHVYSPFGVAVDNAPNTFSFSSEYFDNETMLLYYNYRYYILYTGKWQSIDRNETKEPIDMYLYISNNPIIYTDYLGMINLKPAPDGTEFLRNIFINLMNKYQLNKISEGCRTIKGEKDCCCVVEITATKIDFDKYLIRSINTTIVNKSCSDYIYPGSIGKPGNITFPHYIPLKCCD